MKIKKKVNLKIINVLLEKNTSNRISYKSIPVIDVFNKNNEDSSIEDVKALKSHYGYKFYMKQEEFNKF